MAALDRFSPVARAWFEGAFEAPTEAQERGWEAISGGSHTLILAPTGSGKTLAAFLWALDRLATATGPPPDEKHRLKVLYVSPLKALTYDIERNLRAPLAGMAMEAERRGLPVPDIRVATRTGDTSQSDRRDLVRHPPDILVTTPESLYLMLTSQAREVLRSVEHVIVDEIHSVAPTKRGAHLALSLERLERLTATRPRARRNASASRPPSAPSTRWPGSSAAAPGTQTPASGTPGPSTVVDAGVRKPLELQVVVPVEDMAELGRVVPDMLVGPAAGDPEVRHSIWPAIHPVLLDLIHAHTSTLIFVNSRRLAERLAARLNELATQQSETGEPVELVRAHHGSIAREQRLEIEDALKAGKLPALVATSSLELGIDMGAIDLVVQVEAPPSVASGLQRIGRAGHQVGQASKGRIFPKFRGDLVVAAVVVSRMKGGLIEETKVPRNPLDVLAQQIVAMCAVDDVTVDEVADTAGAAYPFADLTRPVLEGVLDMLAGRYPSDQFGDLRPRINWDRTEGTLKARAGARMLAVVSGGTIPDRGLYGVFTPEGSRVGELDEEFVYESRPGETMVLGASTWRIEDITRDRVVVTPAPGEPGKMPFWHGDGVGRPAELGRAIGAFLRDVDSWTDERLAEECSLDALAVANLRDYLKEERAVTGGVLPPTARWSSSASATSWATGGCACCPRSAARSTPRGRSPSSHGYGTSWGSRSRPSGATRASSSACPRPTRRHRSTWCWSTPTRSRSWWSASWPTRRCSRPGSGRTRPGPCSCPGAGPAPARPSGRCASGRRTCWRWRPSTASSPSCWRPTGSACATSSTSPPSSTCSPASGPAPSGWCRWRPPRRRRSPPRWPSPTWPTSSTTATPPSPSAGPRPSPSTGRCWPSCWAPRSCGSSSTPPHWPPWRTTCRPSTSGAGRGTPTRPATTCGAWATSPGPSCEPGPPPTSPTTCSATAGPSRSGSPASPA